MPQHTNRRDCHAISNLIKPYQSFIETSWKRQFSVTCLLQIESVQQCTPHTPLADLRLAISLDMQGAVLGRSKTALTALKQGVNAFSNFKDTESRLCNLRDIRLSMNKVSVITGDAGRHDQLAKVQGYFASKARVEQAKD